MKTPTKSKNIFNITEGDKITDTLWVGKGSVKLQVMGENGKMVTVHKEIIKCQD